VTKDDLIFFKDWFSHYVKSFYSLDVEDQKNISLKEKHTSHVCKNIIEITNELNLGDRDIMLAETAALFHDIGRFPQYAKYKTFKDAISVNHGFLGAKTLLGEKILQKLPDDEQKLIIKAVRFHNAFSIPKKEREEIVFFIKLLRDADKLDIWRVFIEYYESPKGGRASAVGLGLLDTADYSQEIISHIDRGQMASQSKLKNLNDFKLMQLSWIYDINFKPSFRLLSERNYIDKIVSQLPNKEEIKSAVLSLKKYVQMRLND